LQGNIFIFNTKDFFMLSLDILAFVIYTAVHDTKIQTSNMPVMWPADPANKVHQALRSDAQAACQAIQARPLNNLVVAQKGPAGKNLGKI